MSPVRRALSKSAYVLLALGLVMGGCSGCNNDDLLEVCDCTSDDVCQTMSESCRSFHESAGGAIGTNTYCHAETRRCMQDKFECDPSASNDGACCPGQICSPLAGVCTNKYTTCTDDDSCVVKGQVCQPLGSPAGDPGCTFERCGAEGACADGLSCFNGFCVGEPPCNGGCAAGQVCVPAANRCFRPGDVPEWPASCDQSCEPGTVLVFVDGTNVFDRCDRSEGARACECQALPPIEPRDMARHSSSAAAGGKVYVSAYDADHGDLVVHTFDAASGKREKTEWVDGVPTNGAIIADPNGPRGGRATPGEDVGQYTSIATDGSVLHVAYYAVKDGTTALGDLRYARRSASGEWTIHVVDGRTGGADTTDVGLYTSLALNNAGVPYISYFQRGGMGADAFKTALKVARAKKADPSSASDWEFDVVAEGTRTPPPCAQPACTGDEVCTAAPTAPNGLCRTKAANSACSPACGGDEACALDAVGAPTCFPSLRAATLASLPEGNGLFSSLAFIDNKPVVVWYDENAGQLRGAVASGAGFSAGDARVLDDGVVPGAPAPHNVGQFASVAVAPAGAAKRLAVSYFDATARQLKVLTANADWSDITPPAERVADDGRGDPEIDPVLFVGADTSVAFDAANNVVVAYQDATSGDLRVARPKAGTALFEVSPLRTEGACGFYANLTKDGDKLFVSHAIIKAESASKSANRLEVLAVP